MYRHILVPLDGSELAEQVLSYVKKHAHLSKGTRVTLLTSVSGHSHTSLHPNEGVFARVVSTETTEHEAARLYLKQLANELQMEGIGVTMHVSHQPAAEAILSHAHKTDVDLIAIATHGRSGIGRWIFGSVAQKVIQAAHTPVLVVRPTEA